MNTRRRYVLFMVVLMMVPWCSFAQETIHADGFEIRLACEPAESGGSANVSAPKLLATLFDAYHPAWLASPAVVDLNNDQVPEILVARHGKIIGWHMDNSIVFDVTVDARIWSSPVVADFVTDNVGLEVAAASGDKVYLWDFSGQVMDGFPVTWRDEIRSLAAGDIDGDDNLELVAVTTDALSANSQRDIILAINHLGGIATGFPPNTTGASGCDEFCFVTGGYDQNIAIGNVDEDKGLEIFASQDNSYLSLHKGNGLAFNADEIFNQSTKFPGIRFLHDYDEAQQGWAVNEETANQSQFTSSAPVIADIDDDGIGELIVLGSVQNAAQSDRERGVALWVIKPDGTRPANWTQPYHVSGYLAGLYSFSGSNIVGATNQVSAANINPYRPGPEFVFAGFDGRIHAVDSRAQPVWQYTYTTDDRVLTGGVVIADLSRDGTPEIVFASYSPDDDKSALFILNAEGKLLHRTPLPDTGAMSVPSIADANGNGTLDIVVNLNKAVNEVRQALVFEIAGSSDNCLLWPTGRGNLLRDGYLR